MKKLNSIRTLILAGSLLLQLNTLCFQSRGAAGDVDLSFDPGLGVNGPVNIVLVQPDGKVLIAGQFNSVKGLLRTGLARLNADGSGDTTFDPGTAYYQVSSLALQPDGKVLVGSSGIYRLNSDGSQDTNFVANLDPDSEGYAWVYSIAAQPDGKVLVGGYFYTQNGTNIYLGITRLNANGSLDGSFNPGTGLSGGRARSVALQPDGKVLIGGDFFGVNGTNRNGIARLNSNGSLDLSFNPGTGVVGYVSGYGVRSVVLQSDGKVLVGGDFTTVNGTNRNGITRLNSNGSLDLSFNPGTGAVGYASGFGVSSVALQSDGKVLIGGPFTTVNGTNRNGIARLHANGGLDTSFNPGTGAIGVAAAALHTNGQVFIGGAFTTVNGTNRNRIARLNADGSLDGSFHPGTGVDSLVRSLAVQPDGKVLIDGFINGTNRYGRARLNVDGSVDTAFIPASFNPDLAAGFYVPCPPNLACDNFLLHFSSFAVQPDGKVLAGVSYYHLEYDSGGFTVAGYFINHLARFNANGSLDGSFYFVDLNGGINSITPQSDGKIIIVGEFTSKILRLNADGNQDYSFNPGTGANGSVSSVVLQPDGKVLIGGSFSTVNGTNRNGIARLNSTGSLDSTFNPGTEVGSTVFSIAWQPDGKVLIGGPFTTVNGTNRNGIARLNANGSLDSTFNPGTGVENTVYSVALQPDGKVLIGGDFTTVNGVLRRFVARLYGDSVAPSLNIARSNAFVIVSWPVTGLSFQLQENTDLLLPNSWSPFAQPAVTNAGQISVTVPTTAGQKFFRLKMQ